MITTLKLWIISCLLFTNILNSEELLQRGEAYILTESSWHEVKAREKESFKESKKEKRKRFVYRTG